MKSTWTSILFYIGVVLLPSIIISSYFVYSELQEKKLVLQAEAKQTASVYRDQLDQLLGKTKASLEMLAKVLATKEFLQTDEIRRILEESNQESPLYFGFYFADSQGNVQIGSSPIGPVNILDNNYVQSAIVAKETKISPLIKNHTTGGELVTMVTPIIDKNEKTIGLLLVNIRVDYIQNIMRVLTPDEGIKVLNGYNQIIFETENVFKGSNQVYVETILRNAPWNIQVGVNEHSITWLFWTIFKYSSIFLFITNTIYLLNKYMVLRKNAKYEKLQNESQKLEIVGQLAASSAHEIRNPLTGIKGLVQLLSEKYKDKEDRFYFEVIQQEISRINEIVSEFLVLGNPIADIHSLNDIKHIMNELLPLIQSEANLYNIQLSLEMDEQSMMIYCAKDHVKQVILNITKNALEAMKNGGNIAISIKKVDHYCSISIKDTGVGIPRELVNKIFDPFFTLKETGTGLGLVVCKRIVTMYGGEISIHSELTVGTEVKVLFPAE
ncbi:ATP-binding protein [Bacillus sp. DJP31]|uniref:ATP-binding protein n=1 Tax=Bacillus sp. DJP31 TaxID=3409789 RepID=UPI003BB5782C